jgi:hypothetical protein
VPDYDELQEKNSKIDAARLPRRDEEQRRGAESDQKQRGQSGVVPKKQEIPVHLQNGGDVLHLEIEAIPQTVFILGVGRNFVPSHALQPREIDPRVGLRVEAEGAMPG